MRIAVALACGERVKFAMQTLRAIRESPLRDGDKVKMRALSFASLRDGSCAIYGTPSSRGDLAGDRIAVEGVRAK